MNYEKVYADLIKSRQEISRTKTTDYYESHHIIPRSMGGNDDSSNLVLLTPREHFIAHCLLWKIYKVRKMRDAVLYFKGKHLQFSNSKLYESARIAHIKEMKENNPSLHLTEEAKRSKREKLKAYIKTEEHRKNISKAAKGKQRRLGAILEDKSKEKISNSLKEYFLQNGFPDETREKIRIANIGKKHSRESIDKQKQRALNRKKYMCPHCQKSYDGGNLKQHMLKNGFTLKDIEDAKKI